MKFLTEFMHNLPLLNITYICPANGTSMDGTQYVSMKFLLHYTIVKAVWCRPVN